VTAAAAERRVVVLGGILAGAVPFAVYVATLAPTVTFDDSGELIAGAATLGVYHPSGYPAATLYNHLFTYIPWGRIAWRTNLASATAAAAACLALYVFVTRATRAPGIAVASAAAGLTAAWTFGFSKTFWSQAVVTEVYTLNIALVAVVLYAGYRWLEENDARWGYAAVFTMGAALTVHSSSSLVIASALIYALLKVRRFPSLRTVSLGLVFILAGAGLLSYLPLRAVQNPPLNWGEPSTLPLFWAHLTRRMYGGPEIARLTPLGTYLIALAKETWAEVGPVAVVLAAGGVIGAVVRKERPWGFVLWLAALTGPVATALLILLLRPSQLREMPVWRIPFYFTVAAFVGFAVFRVAVSRRRLMHVYAIIIVCGAAAWEAVINWAWNDYRRYYWAEDTGANLLRTIGYEGVNVAFDGGLWGIFECSYLKIAEGRRPDHIVADGTGTVFRDYRGLAPRRPLTRDGRAMSEWSQEFETAFLNQARARPVYFIIPIIQPESPPTRFVAAGLLWRAAGEVETENLIPAVWVRYVTRGYGVYACAPLARRFADDANASDTVVHYYLMLAEGRANAGDDAGACEARRKAAAAVGSAWQTAARVGGAFRAARDGRAAANMYRAAIRNYPAAGKFDSSGRRVYAGLWADLGRAFIVAGEVAAAEGAFKESLAVWPDQPGVRDALRPGVIEAAVVEARRRSICR
jgi:hypothetical protein